MDRKDEGEEGPLSSEALKRDEWRGDAASLRPKDAPGHTLPESERGLEDPDEDGSDRLNPLAGTMLPPD